MTNDAQTVARELAHQLQGAPKGQYYSVESYDGKRAELNVPLIAAALQQARREALEEAAKICDSYDQFYASTQGQGHIHDWIVRRCANAIRRQAQEPPQEENHAGK